MNTSPTPPAFLRGAIDPSTCVSIAWELVKTRPLLYIGAALLMIVVTQIPYIGFLFTAPFIGGFAYIVLNDLKRQPIDFGMLFKGFDRFGRLLLIGLVQAIPAGIYLLVLSFSEIATFLGTPAPGDGTFFQQNSSGEYSPYLTAAFVFFAIGYIIFLFIWHLATFYAVPLVVEHDTSFGESIGTGLSAAYANFGGMIVLGLFCGLVALLGLLALCVGIFVAYPVCFAANVVAYRQVFPSGDQDDFVSNFGSSSPPSIFGFND